MTAAASAAPSCAAPLLSLATRAAQYVRMSTDHQQYSIGHQREAIAAYASAHGFEIVRTFEDAGKSGVTLNHRDGLCELLAEVSGGRATFRTILVYDVSRWGRFQDSDEAACYEFMCRKAGVQVVYCMEQFPSDGSPMSSVLKGLKRVMAGEYSRELSAKVHAAQCRMVRMGFAQGGKALYGLRRMVVDATGKPRGLVAAGQRKFIQTDRVVLVPGPEEERAVVRWVFAQVAYRRKRPQGLARDLNRRGVPSTDRMPWTAKRVRDLLDREQYVGNIVYNRRSAYLGGPMRWNPRERWVRAEGVIEPLVSRTLFRRVQEAVASWSAFPTREEAIAMLKDLLARRGRLSGVIIGEAEGMPSEHYYREHFGSLANAYRLAGFRPRNDWRFSDQRPARLERLREFRAAVLDGLRALGCDAQRETKAVVRLPNGVRVAVLVAVARARRGRPAWIAQHHLRNRPDLALVARTEGPEAVIRDYYLLATGSNLIHLREPYVGRLLRAHSADLHEVLPIIAVAR